MRPTILALAAVLLMLSSATLLAQQATHNPPPVNMPDWATGTGIVVGVCGGPVFGIWVAWFHIAKLNPRKDRQHAEDIKSIQIFYAAEFARARVEFLDAIREIQKYHSDHLTLVQTTARDDGRQAWAVQREDSVKLREAVEELTEQVRNVRSCQYAATGPRASEMHKLDRTGLLLHIGDRVCVHAVITGFQPVDEFDNVVLETIEPKYPGPNRTPIILNARQLDLVESLGDTETNVDISKALEDSQAIKSIKKSRKGDR